MSETEQKKPTSAKGGGETENPFSMVGPDMAARISQATMQGLTEQQQQMSRFMAHRLEEVARLQQRLAASNSPTALFDAYSDFTLTAMRDYGEQAGKMQKTFAESMSMGATKSKIDREGR